MPPILNLVQRPTTPGDESARVATRDVYDFDELDLSAYHGIAIASACDQRFLAQRADRLSSWVRDGGRLLTQGHPIQRYVDGMPQHRKLDFHSTSDLWLEAMGSHPIWDGVDRRDLLFNTGVPGVHSFEKLKDIGVAGFYARAYLVSLPADATVITGIGPGRLPVDVAYPLGTGEVIVHLGGDLLSYTRPGTSAVDLGERAHAYLEGAFALQEVAR